MPNWFESNATKSVIIYTIVVVTATWAVSRFVLQDNRLSFAKSQLETEKSLTEQYKSKVELLQRDLDAIRDENAEYRRWLGKIEHAIPVIVPRITELKQRVDLLEKSLSTQSPHSASQAQPTHRDGLVRRGDAYIDEQTGLVLAVREVNVYRQAQISLKLPDNEDLVTAHANPGDQWRFTAKDQAFTLTITSISYVTDAVNFRIDLVR
ncbi:hypothetical protein H0A73_22600 [Alcaligenaceae bacterium]|nr:hypothetical protein [Alcaligenaceae bacterium]